MSQPQFSLRAYTTSDNFVSYDKKDTVYRQSSGPPELSALAYPKVLLPFAPDSNPGGTVTPQFKYAVPQNETYWAKTMWWWNADLKSDKTPTDSESQGEITTDASKQLAKGTYQVPTQESVTNSMYAPRTKAGHNKSHTSSVDRLFGS